MAWTFTADSEIQKEVASKIFVACLQLEVKFKMLYEEIINLDKFWKGADYDLFKAKCEEYYSSVIVVFIQSIKLYAIHLNNLSEGTKGLTKNLLDSFKKMERIVLEECYE